MLISKFEEIKMLEEETFGEFYTKVSDLRNSMVSLGKQISDVKLIRKILRSLPEHFRIKVTTIEESKDLEEMKIEDGRISSDIRIFLTSGQKGKDNCSQGI